MGFCLFENYDGSGAFIAVNAGQIESFDPCKEEQPMTILSLYGGRVLNVRGLYDDVKKILRESSKIGMKSLNLHLLGGLHAMLPTPTIFRKAQNVLYVEEVAAEDLSSLRVPDLSTASTIYMDDGSSRMVLERPGVFARLANAKGKVPILDMRNVRS